MVTCSLACESKASYCEADFGGGAFLSAATAYSVETAMKTERMTAIAVDGMKNGRSGISLLDYDLGWGRW